MDLETLKNPPKKYRPMPFWSWNDRLEPAETVEQIKKMDEAHMGGFFMHARGGLQTEYMSNEWFDNVKVSIVEAKKCGMFPWGYDENGWPSGFGAGSVNGLGIKYCQKYLRYEITDTPKQTDCTITNIEYNDENYHFYYEINPFYVDTLDCEVTKEFLRVTHEKYKKTLGTDFISMSGFFTDEPQVSRNGFPWSFILEREYRKAYGDTIADKLLSLFKNVGEFKAVRYNYWRLIRDLFAENYMKTIYDWCRKNGSQLTGHLVLEENYASHIKANGACMSLYEYMDIPGIDNLCRVYAPIQTTMQVTSAAAQLGKKQILSESFAMSGWNVSFEDLRAMFEDQLCHGVTLLCPHLESYTLKGIRKRDYPASLFAHQPWWEDYKVFNDTVSRIGMLISEGEIDYKILVLHTVESGWLELGENNGMSANIYCLKMVETMTSLENAQLQYHLGDERLMSRYALVEGDILKIGSQSYSVIIVPPASCIGRNTFELLKKFKENGGNLFFTGEVPSYIDGIETDEVINLSLNCEKAEHKNAASLIPENLHRLTVDYPEKEIYPVTACVREFKKDGMTLYYLHNRNEKSLNTVVTVSGESAEFFDPTNGEITSAEFKKDNDKLKIKCNIAARGSKLIFVYDREIASSKCENDISLTPLNDKLSGGWEVECSDENALTLDYCDLYFDGELKQKNIHINDVQELACKYGREVKIELVFKFLCKEDSFDRCSLVIETPEIFEIKVNGCLIENKVTGYYFDKSFKKIDIRKYIISGENEIYLCCDFVQSAEVYKRTENSLIFESEKNMLSYDMEIEQIYLVGDFAVKTDSEFVNLPRKALKTNGGFYITSNSKIVHDGSLINQGYPFFAGEITLKKKFSLDIGECENRSFILRDLGAIIASVEINGKKVPKIMWQPYSVDLTELLNIGENVIKLTLTTSLRNLLGPFHSTDGESYSVSPADFFHNSPIWSRGENNKWDDGYCFVNMGLFI